MDAQREQNQLFVSYLRGMTLEEDVTDAQTENFDNTLHGVTLRVFELLASIHNVESLEDFLGLSFRLHEDMDSSSDSYFHLKIGNQGQVYAKLNGTIQFMGPNYNRDTSLLPGYNSMISSIQIDIRTGSIQEEFAPRYIEQLTKIMQLIRDHLEELIPHLPKKITFESRQRFYDPNRGRNTRISLREVEWLRGFVPVEWM